MGKIEAVVFDLDGTLVDSLDDIARSVNLVLAARGRKTLSSEEYRPLVGWGLRRLIASATAEAPLPPQELEDAFQAVLEEYRSHPVVHSKLFGGISDLLARLAASLPLGVLSNKDDSVTQAVMAVLLPNSPFKSVVGARPEFAHKPDPGALLSMLAEWGVSPADSVYLGDSEIDIQTAKNAGCHAFGVTWGFRDSQELKRAGAEMIFHQPKEIGDWILSEQAGR